MLGSNYDLLFVQLATRFLEFRVMLLEWAGSITCVGVSDVTHFATDIIIETDPKCLNGLRTMRFEEWLVGLHKPMES